jgi:hypothetical protein
LSWLEPENKSILSKREVLQLIGDEIISLEDFKETNLENLSTLELDDMQDILSH